MLGGLDDEATLRGKLGMVNRAFGRFYEERDAEGRAVRRRRRRVSSDGLEEGIDWDYVDLENGDSRDVIGTDDDGAELADQLQEWANSPAGELMVVGHEEGSSAGHDGGDYEGKLQDLANQHAGEVMIVAREEEERARHDDEYDDRIQELANEQAGSVMIVARDDNL